MQEYYWLSPLIGLMLDFFLILKITLNSTQEFQNV